jgi:oligopeptide/dipeptide ABC transporter ATP-binding protein
MSGVGVGGVSDAGSDAPSPRRASVSAELDQLVKTPSIMRRAVRRYMRMAAPMIALFIIVVMLFLTFFGGWVATHDPAEQSLDRFAPASSEHYLGTDDLGRDTFSRLVVGTEVSVRSGFQVTLMALIFAVPLGLLAGYIGGTFDLVLMRFMDAIISFPGLVLVLAVVGVLGPGLTNAMAAITVAIVPGFVRLIRAQALSLREEVYVEASQSIGTPMWTILRTRIIPGVASPLIVAATILLGAAMLIEAGLSFLGFGQQPPDPSWGNMLQRGFTYIFTEPWQTMIPGTAIALAVLSFNMAGDGLRDALGLAEQHKSSGMKRGRMGLTSADDAREEPISSQPPETLLAIRDLSVQFATPAGTLTVVKDVSFDVRPGEVVGLVGESGCGKSVTSSAVMRILASPPALIPTGQVWFDGRDLLTLPFNDMRKVRGVDIAMVFQDPMSSLNPGYTIGNQLMEAVRAHAKVSRSEARRRTVELLEKVDMPDPAVVMNQHPHNLSGGMRQRVLIAMALINGPKLLIADEPTTALDVTVQAQILDLLKGLQTELDMGVIFVTHDLGVVADICDRVQVMYAGQIIESGTVREIFHSPRHPYTAALLKAMPQSARGDERLVSIPGVVPPPNLWPKGCHFGSRCDYVTDACTAEPIEMEDLGGGRVIRCLRHSEVAVELASKVAGGRES